MAEVKRYKARLLELIKADSQEEQDKAALEATMLKAASGHTFLKPVVHADRIENGKEVTRWYCMECGKYGQAPGHYGWKHRGVCGCGNDCDIPERCREIEGTEKFSRVLEVKEGCLYFSFLRPWIVYSADDYDHRTVRVENRNSLYGFLTHENLRFFDEETGKWFSHGRPWRAWDGYKNCLKNLQMLEIHDKNMNAEYKAFLGKDTLGDILDAVELLEKTPAANVKSAIRFEDVKLSDVDKALLPYSSVFSRIKEENREARITQYFCPTCRSVFEKAGPAGQRFITVGCPTCGQKIASPEGAAVNEYGLFFENALVDGKPFFVMRLFLRKAWNINLETKDFSEAFEEEQRIFVSEKKAKKYAKYGGHWERDVLRNDYWHDNCRLMQTMEEIKKVVETSPAPVYSLFAFLTDVKTHQNGCVSANAIVQHLKNCLKTPQISEMARCGMAELALRWDASFGSLVANEKASDLAGFFGITEGQLRLLQSVNPGTRIFWWMQIFAQMPDVTYEDYAKAKAIVDACSLDPAPGLFERCLPGAESVISILRESHIPVCFVDIAKYLESCYLEQYIGPEEAIWVWSQYLGMAQSQGRDLVDETVRCPDSLRKAYDAMVFAKAKEEHDRKMQGKNS